MTIQIAHKMRHMCRNPHCRSKLPAPVENDHHAFCTLGCHAVFYRSRCLVCEEPMRRKNDAQRFGSGHAVCRSEYRRFPGVFDHPQVRDGYGGTAPVIEAPETSIKPALGWRVVAGPPLSPTSLRLATLPLDPAVAARQAQQHAGYVELRRQRREAARRAADVALFKPDSAPLNLLGGYRFANAPAIGADLVKAIARTESRLESSASPLVPDADPWALPDFLRRVQPWGHA